MGALGGEQLKATVWGGRRLLVDGAPTITALFPGDDLVQYLNRGGLAEATLALGL